MEDSVKSFQSLTNRSGKKINQLQRLVKYTIDQKTKRSEKSSYINKDEALHYNPKEEIIHPELKTEEPKSEVDILSSYQEQIAKLNNQLNSIKSQIAVNSIELLTLEQERLQEELAHQEKTQQELLRHQSSLKKHNEFMTKQYERLMPEKNGKSLPFL